MQALTLTHPPSRIAEIQKEMRGLLQCDWTHDAVLRDISQRAHDFDQAELQLLWNLVLARRDREAAEVAKYCHSHCIPESALVPWHEAVQVRTRGAGFVAFLSP